jgi:phosphate transport system permease protein
VSTATSNQQAGPASALSERRPFGDRLFQILALAAGLLVLAILILIAYSTSDQASNWFSTEGLSGVFSTTWDTAHNKFGALGFVYGTAISSSPSSSRCRSAWASPCC